MRPTHLTRLVRVETQEREQTAPRETIRVRVVYEDPFGEGPMEGDGAEYLYELPPRPGEPPC